MIKPRFIATLFWLMTYATVSAFTVVPKAMTVMRPITTTMTPSATTTTSLPVLVDPAIAEVAKIDPIGSIIMLVIIGSLYELFTPGRAKKA